MKKKYLLILLLFTMQSVLADSFFRVLSSDIKAFVKGDASSEQKERLGKQAAVLIISASITLYCVAAAGAMWNGEKVPSLELGKWSQKLADSKGKKKARRRKSDSILIKPSMHKLPAPSKSMRKFFDQPTPSPHSALREYPIEISERSRADTGSVRPRGKLLVGEELEPLVPE